VIESPNATPSSIPKTAHASSPSRRPTDPRHRDHTRQIRGEGSLPHPLSLSRYRQPRSHGGRRGPPSARSSGRHRRRRRGVVHPQLNTPPAHTTPAPEAASNCRVHRALPPPRPAAAVRTGRSRPPDDHDGLPHRPAGRSAPPARHVRHRRHDRSVMRPSQSHVPAPRLPRSRASIASGIRRQRG